MKQKDRDEILLLVATWRFKAKSLDAMAKQEVRGSPERCTYEAEASTFKLCAAELARLLPAAQRGPK